MRKLLSKTNPDGTIELIGSGFVVNLNDYTVTEDGEVVYPLFEDEVVGGINTNILNPWCGFDEIFMVGEPQQYDNAAIANLAMAHCIYYNMIDPDVDDSVPGVTTKQLFEALQLTTNAPGAIVKMQ